MLFQFQIIQSIINKIRVGFKTIGKYNIILVDNNSLIKYHILMIKIMFVCHGNICRSPMAEFELKDMVKRRGLENDFVIASSATSTEEFGMA